MDEKYWNREIETMKRKELGAHQLKLFREKVKFCYENTRFYRNKLKAAGVTPGDIKTLDDAQKIPFTVKDDFI